MLLSLLAALVVGGVIAGMHLTGGGGNSTPSQAALQRNCASSGCGLVSQSLQQVQPTGFYGASCTGDEGTWFLKIMQTGSSGDLRATYDLHWSLSHDGPARPSGTVVVRPRTGAAKASDVTVTIDRGKVRLAGTEEPSKTPLTATGTLTVSLSKRPGFPTLRFVETGLTQTEAALGFNSPFTFDGKPLNLLLQHASILAGC